MAYSLSNTPKKILCVLALTTLGLVFLLPFVLNWRRGPQSSFYLEALSWTLVLLLTLLVTCSGLIKRSPPSYAWSFWVLALFWPIQAELMALPYPGFSYLMSGIFITLFFLSWCIDGLLAKYGLKHLLIVIAWAILIACLWQSFVVWMQYYNVSDGQFIKHAPVAQVFGQLGQRNHLGHFMMWGLCATGYLMIVRACHVFLGTVCALILSLSMGLIGSRTILIYLTVLSAWVILWGILHWKKTHARRTTSILLIIFLSAFLSQVFLPYMLTFFTHTPYLNNGLMRFQEHASDAYRVFEWQKAWALFLEKPLWGHGWMSYAWVGFDKSLAYSVAENPHLGQLFTHTHQSLLQLLVEIGLVGTLLCVGVFFWIIHRLFIINASTPLLCLTLLILSSVIHSSLEYPMWYIYFLFPFCSLAMLAYPASPQKQPLKPRKCLCLSALLIGFLAFVLYMTFQYTKLITLRQNIQEGKNQTAQMMAFSHEQPFLAYYADLILLTNPLHSPSDTDHNTVYYRQILDKNIRFRPYPSLIQQKLRYAQADNNPDTYDFWFKRCQHYYPDIALCQDRSVDKNETH